ncbi:protealysin inhibitor emfourin [Merismopedia glauca]
MLLGKLIALAAVGSLTLLIQFCPLLNSTFNFPNDLVAYQIPSVDRNQHNGFTKVNYLSGMPEYFSWLWLSKHHRINKVELPMKIKFRQSGGYAGLRIGCELDTNLLPPEEATKLQSLVEQSDIFPTKSDRSENTADLINYEITIETKEGTHQVTFDDLTLPENIIPLLDYLQDRAKPLR